MAIQGMPAVRVSRPISDPNYGREEYIEDCVRRILKGENVLVAFGCMVGPESLIPVLRTKYSGFFPGFTGALEEIVSHVEKAGEKVFAKPFHGSNSHALGLLDSGPDGYFVSLANDLKA
ncbi:MAG: hypothetical protein JSS10_07940 [Verrucomicrobia bacterium]|nr:hypothetical protein [Verrucomicrobiota bacterium]